MWMASFTVKERLKLKLGRNIFHPCISGSPWYQRFRQYVYISLRASAQRLYVLSPRGMRYTESWNADPTCTVPVLVTFSNQDERRLKSETEPGGRHGLLPAAVADPTSLVFHLYEHPPSDLTEIIYRKWNAFHLHTAAQWAHVWLLQHKRASRPLY